MSRRNETINRMVQASGLYKALAAPRRRALVALIQGAYDAGHKHGAESATASTQESPA